jgi:hypothetical protein
MEVFLVAMNIPSFQKSATQVQPKTNPKFGYGIGNSIYFQNKLFEVQDQLDLLKRENQLLRLQNQQLAGAKNIYPVVRSNLTFASGPKFGADPFTAVVPHIVAYPVQKIYDAIDHHFDPVKKLFIPDTDVPEYSKKFKHALRQFEDEIFKIR